MKRPTSNCHSSQAELQKEMATNQKTIIGLALTAAVLTGAAAAALWATTDRKRQGKEDNDGWEEDCPPAWKRIMAELSHAGRRAWNRMEPLWSKRARERREFEQEVSSQLAKNVEVRAGMPRGILSWASPMEVEVRRIRAEQIRQEAERGCREHGTPRGEYCFLCAKESENRPGPDLEERCEDHGEPKYDCWVCEGIQRGLPQSTFWDDWEPMTTGQSGE